MPRVAGEDEAGRHLRCRRSHDTPSGSCTLWSIEAAASKCRTRLAPQALALLLQAAPRVLCQSLGGADASKCPERPVQ